MHVVAQLIGYPRIGPNRELKWALERMWSGRLAADAFAERVDELRRAHLAEQREAVGSAVDDFFLYDEVLETALMLGVRPANLGGTSFDLLTALARGTPEREAWEMTKWFDTNYHYVVPELDRLPERLSPMRWREPLPGGSIIWPILGPYSFVRLSKHAGLDATDLGRAVGAAIGAWMRSQPNGFRLQLDEPCLGMRLDPADEALRDAAYDALGEPGAGTPPLVTVQFGAASASTLQALGARGYAVQMPLERVAALRGTPGWDAQPEHVVAVMDGRSVWPDAFDPVRQALGGADDGRTVRLVPSTSLMFLPYTVEGEELTRGFQFAREKARTLATWAAALTGGPAPTTTEPPAPSGRRSVSSSHAPRARPAVPHRPTWICRPTRPPPPVRSHRPARSAICAPSSIVARSTARPTTPGSPRSSPIRSPGRNEWGSTSSSTASSSAPTWSSTSRPRWTAFSPPTTDGSSPTGADAPVRRSWPHLRPSPSR